MEIGENILIFGQKKNENLLLIKYEDLIKDLKVELKKIIIFLEKYLDFKTNEKKIENIIRSTNFDNLKKGEKEGDFLENVFKKSSNQKINFFHKGPENNWKFSLENKIVDEINLKFKNEMIELGYL